MPIFFSWGVGGGVNSKKSVINNGLLDIFKPPPYSTLPLAKTTENVYALFNIAFRQPLKVYTDRYFPCAPLSFFPKLDSRLELFFK